VEYVRFALRLSRPTLRGKMSRAWDAVANTVEFSAPLDLAAIRTRISSSAEILEIGCGYGRIMAQLESDGYVNIRGYDASAKMIERARTDHPHLHLAVADATALPDLDSSVDAIVIVALLTSLPAACDRRAVVAEIRRVLRPSGTIHGVEFLRQQDAPYSIDGTFTSKAGPRMCHFSPDELRDLFSDFGEWHAWEKETTSLSGANAVVLQFVAAQPILPPDAARQIPAAPVGTGWASS
jgi:ubiquinone/menaquinone biosynthesis C-methylase UbiE